MEKLNHVLRQPEFHALLFIVCLIIFSYPLALMTNMAAAAVIYLALFLPWFIIILLLFIITRSYTASRPDRDQKDEDVSHV